VSEGYRTVRMDVWLPLARGIAERLNAAFMEDCEELGLFHPRDFDLPMNDEDVDD